MFSSEVRSKIRAIVTDYDGTIALNGVVSPSTIASLERWKAAGKRLLLVTGRVMRELQAIFPRIDLFDLIVAENGALLFDPLTGEETLLADASPPSFVQELQARGVAPIEIGRVIVATWEPHEKKVLDVIRELGLDWHIIFNKGAVMMLPTSVTKESGLIAGLKKLSLEASDVLGVGDAENDLPFIAACAVGVAVANALPSVKARAHVVTSKDHGDGVSEIITALLAGESYAKAA